ncbi:MAG: hypothetical protein A3J69_02085 [Candidatus Levybacteria bacterium RIFCSPHIGHO2_02_FULL_42_12]|nr:MAG: hypothetical protein A2698_00440 [Candidatus Levybacteria bacterium RIFCSPHIGHO2_01_FULL_42_15]OGH30742.1 MAG: hypothetical protein A3J69_02085 [Candidatus Levybacteria bacterium RIFCSPHIGHO2_02_FULL_42_12]OGH42993.1 MAG: hypothetical protein A3B53_02910 [Candidatus Levybacteria bacterium RIFCSPLOWO2_01_FULL_42_15]
MRTYRFLQIFTDGGSRGNPGPSASAFVVLDATGTVIHEEAKVLGVTTNNVAEYQAIVDALFWISRNANLLQKESSVLVCMDSQLAYSQIVGLYKMKNARLAKLLFKIREYESQIHTAVRYEHIPRNKNKKPDALVNKALDNRFTSS